MYKRQHTLNGQSIPQNINIVPESSGTDYVDIGGTLKKLRGLSDYYFERGSQFSPVSSETLKARGITAPPDALVYDMNDIDPQDTSKEYENTYAMRLSKTDGGTPSSALPGAIFQLQYPTYPEDEADVRYDANGYAIPTGWASVWDLIKSHGKLPELYGWTSDTTEEDVKDLSNDTASKNQQFTQAQLIQAGHKSWIQKTGNPVYENGSLVLNDKQVQLYDRNHNLINPTAEDADAKYLAAMTTLGKTDTTDTADNQIETGSINVSLNVPGRYRFYEEQAPKGFSLDAKTTTQVNTLATDASPEAKVLTIPWQSLYTDANDSNKSVSGLYILNVKC